jgi:hypothetical protein
MIYTYLIIGIKHTHFKYILNDSKIMDIHVDIQNPMNIDI